MSNNYVNRIIDGDSRAFDEVYKTYKAQFIALMRVSQKLSREDAEDLYHKACAVFYNNIATGRISMDALGNSQIKTYLNNTGKYILFNERRKRQTPLTIDTDFILSFGDLDFSKSANGNFFPKEEENYDSELDDKLFIIRTTVRNMPQPCAQILNLAVYMKKSNKEVAEIMNYSGEDTVKTQRSRCMKKLKDKVIERFKLAGYEE